MPVDRVTQGSWRVFCDGCFGATRPGTSSEEAVRVATGKGWRHRVWTTGEGDADERWTCPQCSAGEVAHAR